MKQLLTFICASLLAISCNSTTPKPAETTVETPQTSDSATIMTQETNDAPTDSVFYTPDLAVFDMRGHVRTLTIGNDNFENCMEFSQEGKLVKFTIKNGRTTDEWTQGGKQNPEGIVINRDKKGRIESISYRYWLTRYTYDKTGRYITVEESGEGGQENTIKYTRDENNQVKSMLLTSSYLDVDPNVPVVEKTEVMISNIKVDKCGNWVSRSETHKANGHSSQAQRTITYWQ